MVLHRYLKCVVEYRFYLKVDVAYKFKRTHLQRMDTQALNTYRSNRSNASFTRDNGNARFIRR